MKILYLITKSEFGGAQTHVAQLCRYFKNNGNSVAVMSYPGGWLEDEIKKIGVKFLGNEFFSNSYNPWRAWQAMLAVKKAVNDFQPDIVHCHSSGAGFLGRLAIKNRKPVIFTAHGWAFDEGAPFFRKFVALVCEKIAARFCAKIICVSEFTKREALEKNIADAEKLAVVHNGAALAEAKNSINEKVKIIFVGRLAQQKDPMMLFKAFAKLSKEKVELTLVGDGPDKKMLQDFIDTNNLPAKIISGLAPADVLQKMKESDIFVLPSNWEGLPYTVLEAMSVGLPVIASDVGGVAEAVNIDCGILVRRGDLSGWVDALERLVANKDLRDKIGARARERAQQEFSLDKMLEETEKIYRQVLK